ncbi:hypothetical protein NUTIK01_34280 [Novosphingobium sp. IK01]|uniref:Uncharacterized protein n=1 Tax=Novosphingobium pituita TaxID=3056842 RepID=A0ABQ6PBP7_9SPHN|nr:hypothetical protein NUTIK01_34280 [Novosphingobium sp. IK01]
MADFSINRSAAKEIMSRKISASGAFSTSARRCIMGSVIVVLPNGLSFATQAYPKFTVTTSAPSYTTLGDTILHASIPRLRIKSGSYSKACAARDMLNLYD